MRGDTLADDPEAAESAYRSSLAIARRQGAGLLACKSGLSLAELLQARGRHREAHQLLSDCLAPLGEGADVVAVRNARSMVQALAATM